MNMDTSIQAASMDRRIQNVSPYRPGQPSAKAEGDYDTVTIHGTRYGREDQDFARILARKAAVQLSPGAGSKQVEQLRQMVAAGAYQPSSELIARRLLGLN